MKIVYGTEPYRIDHEVRKLAENTTYYVQVFDAIDGVKEFLQSISFFGAFVREKSWRHLSQSL